MEGFVDATPLSLKPRLFIFATILVSIQRVNWCHWQSVFANGFPKGGSIL
jgi:hypothetical protein